jgi:hypothetical protein
MWLTLPFIVLHFLWSSACWILTVPRGALRHTLVTIARFSGYLINSLEDGRSNWSHFFSIDLPKYSSNVYGVVTWSMSSVAAFHKNIIDSIYDCYELFAVTIPDSFYEISAEPLGDMSPDDWQESLQCIYKLIFMLCIC